MVGAGGGGEVPSTGYGLYMGTAQPCLSRALPSPATGDCTKLHEIFTVLPESHGSGLNRAAGANCAATSQLIPLHGPRLYNCLNQPRAPLAPGPIGMSDGCSLPPSQKMLVAAAGGQKTKSWGFTTAVRESIEGLQGPPEPVG